MWRREIKIEKEVRKGNKKRKNEEEEEEQNNWGEEIIKILEQAIKN